MIPKKLEDGLRNWSPRWRPNRFKATLIALPILAIAIPLAVLAIPYLDVLNDMAVQPKGKPQGQYGWFSRQSLVVERPPVAGTIPMGYVPYTIQGNDEASRKLAEETLTNPLPLDTETQRRTALKRGQKLYNTFCIVCHGERGVGNGRIIGPGLFPAPPSLHTDQALAFKDGRIFHNITRGQNKMPAYADEIDPDDRWAIVYYVRALQRTMQAAKGGGR
jgi:mono/diheme cytochrome c family protein